MDPREVQLREELKTAVAAVRSMLGDDSKVEQRNAKMAEVRALQEKLKAFEEVRTIEEHLIDVPAPPPQGELRAKAGWAEVRSALMEKRALTTNGAGAVNVVNDLMKAFVEKNKILSRVRMFRGASASSVIPVFTPHLAAPAKQTEGGTGIGTDATAVLAAKTLTPYPYFSILAVSHLALTTTPIEAELPTIFNDAFAGAFDNAILVGTALADGGLGVFVASNDGVPTGSDIECAATGYPTIADIVGLVVQAQAVTDNPDAVILIMHPTVYQHVLADTTAEWLVIKQELLQKKCMGADLILTNRVPYATTGGTYVAVAGDFSKYAAAIAAELRIDQINVVGSDNVTFQAWMYANFRPILGAYFKRLKTKS